jgi:hypothetical protein
MGSNKVHRLGRQSRYAPARLGGTGGRSVVLTRLNVQVRCPVLYGELHQLVEIHSTRLR